MNEPEIRPVLRVSDQYPALLKKIPNAPLMLWERGAGLEPGATYLGATGSRGADQETRRVYFEFLLELFKQFEPLVLISGLAKGIDRAAHVAALRANIPTVGVLPVPINDVYPPQNRDVASMIWSKDQPGNAVVSEYAPTVGEDAPFEPLQRNRIIAGASKALLVGGLAKTRSGTYNTIGHAFRQERPIFFVKGTVTAMVREMLIGEFKAEEVAEPQRVVEALQK